MARWKSRKSKKGRRKFWLSELEGYLRQVKFYRLFSSLKMIRGTLYRETNGLLTKLKQSHKQTGADVIVKHLTDYLVREANRKFRCDLSESKKSMSKVEQEARRAIEVLSNKDSVNVQIDSCFEGMDFQMVVNRSRVTMTAPYKSVLEGLFSDFEGETIEEILMCGGAAKSPQFQVKILFHLRAEFEPVMK